MASGPLSGHPVAGVRIEFQGGDVRKIDSNDTAFRLASQQAFKAAYAWAAPQILEPYLAVEFACPDEFLQELLEEIITKDGSVRSCRRFRKGSQKVDAILPLRHMVGHIENPQMFANGHANYSVEFKEFRPVTNGTAIRGPV